MHKTPQFPSRSKPYDGVLNKIIALGLPQGLL